MRIIGSFSDTLSKYEKIKKEYLKDYSIDRMNLESKSFYDEEEHFEMCKKIYDVVSKKYKKANDLSINDRITIYLYYGLICSDYAKFLLSKYGYMHNNMSTAIAKGIVDDDRKKELLSYMKDAENSYKQGLELTINTNNTYIDEYKEQLRILFKDINVLYYLCDDYENFESTCIEAIEEYISIDAASLLIYYYLDNDNYDEAMIYYEKARRIYLEYKEKINAPMEFGLMQCFSYIWHYLYDNGMYKEAKNIASEAQNIIITFTHIRGNKFLDIADDWRTKCIEKIKLNEEKLKETATIEKYIEKDVLEYMSNDIKIYINTAINIYDYLVSKETVYDYSASIMPIMKGLEATLYEIIINNYIPFLREKEYENKLNYRHINEYFLNKRGKLKNYFDSLELGKVLYSVRNLIPNSNGKYTINPYFLEFCKLNGIESEDTIRKFIDDLKQVKDRRNTTAHKERITKDYAEECLNILLINVKYIEWLYKNFKFCFENNEK